jgi:hypothetical protein
MPDEVRNTVGDHVVVNRLFRGEDGRSRFEDVSHAYDQVLGPLRQSQIIEASKIGFHWWPGDFAGSFGLASGQFVVLMLEGATKVESQDGEARVFRPGDVLELASGDVEHSIGSSNGDPFRAAIIDLDPASEAGSRAPPSGPGTGNTLPFVRNVTGDDEQSHFQHGELAYYHRDTGGEVTELVAITRFQSVYAGSDLRYDWHNAPQRQIVLPLTGGTQGENGDGSRCVVPAGGVYFGEDVTGQGHITRAVDDAIRFSIFAHLV